MEPATEERPYRILLCDDIQNVPSSFWEGLVDSPFLAENNLRIVGATTRQCASNPASSLLSNDAVISFSELRLQSSEQNEFVSSLIRETTQLQKLDDAARSMVINAVVDQCGGHVFMQKLDEFAQLPQNRNSETMISYLLSKSFLDHTHTRIWPPNVDDFSAQQRKDLEDAMIDDSKLLDPTLQSLLLMVYFIQDTNQTLEARTWPQLKQEISFKLSARRLCSLPLKS